MLENLRGGKGGAVLISGEAGIGKTTLVDALTDQAATNGITILTGTAHDQEVPAPFGLWQEVFQSTRRYNELPSPSSGLTDTTNLERVGGARELWDLMTHQILAIAEGRPVLLVLEDLHWADQSSVELLRYLSRQVTQAPLLLVMTYRDVDLTPAYPLYHLLPNLVRDIRPARLPLRPLDPDGIRAFIEQRYPAIQPEDIERLSGYLDRYAEGNPLFIEEILGLLEEERVLTWTKNAWCLDTLPDFAVPPLIRQIIEGRLDNLSPAARRALEIASVIGIDVPLDVWTTIGSTPDGDDSSAIEEVLQSAVLEETSRPDVLRFRHTLVRDAIYGSTNVIRRRRWHARVGEKLTMRSDVDPEIVAHHFLQADDERAVDWLIESAQRAGRAFAFQAAIAGYQRALSILEQHPERLSDRVGVLCALAEAHRFTDTRQALTYIREAVDLARRVDDPGGLVLARWVQARVRGFDDQKVLSDLIAAATAFEALPPDEQQRISDSPLGYVVSRATLSQDLANYGMFTAALEQAEAFLAAHARPVSRTQYIEFGNAHFGLGIARAALGDPERGRAAFQSSRSYFRESSNFQMVSNSCYWELSSVLQVYYADQPAERRKLQLEEVQANLHSEFVEARTGERQDSTSETLILDGDWDACWRSANLRLGIPASRVPSARKLAEIEWLRGNRARARDHIRTVMPAGPDESPGRRFFLHRQDLQWIAAEMALDDGDVDLARRWIEAFERWRKWSGGQPGKATAELLWSRSYGLQGHHDEAVQRARRSLELASDPPQPLVSLRAHRLLGKLNLESGELEAARLHLDTALGIAEACDAPYELALTRVIKAELLSQAGTAEQAQALLDDARPTAERLDALPLLERIDRLLKQTFPEKPAESPLGLTPRQLEVLRLLARGLTDAEIADELFISPRTVHGHLNTIYGKLDVETRTAAVARAYAEGILSAQS